MTDTVSVTTGLDEAADAISGFLSDDLLVSDTGNAPNPAPADEDEQAPPREGEGDEGSNTDRETQDDDADKASKTDEDGEEPEADKEDPEASSEKPKTLTVVIDGKEVEVPIEEAAKGYQRQADYSRKTSALADERRAFDGLRQEFAQEAQAVVQERAQYRELLTALHSRLKDLEPQEPNWAELFARDKNEYLIQRDNWRAIQEQRDAAEAEIQRVSAAENARHQQTAAERVQRGMSKLVEWEPRWKDEGARRQDFQSLAKYARDTLGYSEAELRSADDPRALYAVFKAMQYDALQTKAAAVRQQAAPRKPTLKAGGANSQVTPQARSQGNAMQRLVKNGGRVEDAAAIFSGMDL